MNETATPVLPRMNADADQEKEVEPRINANAANGIRAEFLTTEARRHGGKKNGLFPIREGG
jgi:hypothetical protein